MLNTPLLPAGDTSPAHTSSGPRIRPSSDDRGLLMMVKLRGCRTWAERRCDDNKQLATRDDQLLRLDDLVILELKTVDERFLRKVFLFSRLSRESVALATLDLLPVGCTSIAISVVSDTIEQMSETTYRPRPWALLWCCLGPLQRLLYVKSVLSLESGHRRAYHLACRSFRRPPWQRLICSRYS